MLRVEKSDSPEGIDYPYLHELIVSGDWLHHLKHGEKASSPHLIWHPHQHALWVQSTLHKITVVSKWGASEIVQQVISQLLCDEEMIWKKADGRESLKKWNWNHPNPLTKYVCIVGRRRLCLFWLYNLNGWWRSFFFFFSAMIIILSLNHHEEGSVDDDDDTKSQVKVFFFPVLRGRICIKFPSAPINRLSDYHHHHNERGRMDHHHHRE